MSDPLSIAASVGGLALLAKELIQRIGSIIESVRGAKAEMQSLMNEVASLYGILKSLHLILDQMQTKDVAVMTPGKVIFACNATLEEIRKVLERCGLDSNASTTPSGPKPTSKPHSWDSAWQKISWAFKKEPVDMVEALVGFGADVNLLGGRFGTPFQAAWKQRYFDVSTLLLRKGANPSCLSKRELSMLHGVGNLVQKMCFLCQMAHG